MVVPPRVSTGGPPVIEAANLTCRFGKFTAVDHVNFRIERGEIFGFLGSNGCGKSTTMKMLTGLLAPTEGEARLLGYPLDPSDMATRERVGYMSQAFSLYSELTVLQNLELHAHLFHIPKDRREARVQEMLDRFELRHVADSRPESLPLGMRQRLQLAVAIQHQPEVLILDEPTSGVDPVARIRFWRYLIDLSRHDGVTIFLSTHFMNEAERCDRISLMHAGKVLAVGTAKELAARQGTDQLEAAFIAYLEEAMSGKRGEAAATDKKVPEPAQLGASSRSATRLFDWRRLWAYSRRETMEILRDPIRLAFALLGPVILMLTMGYGISFDIEHLTYAALDEDQTRESREFLENLSGSRYFDERADILSDTDLERRLRSGELALAIEMPPNFGKDLVSTKDPEISARLDGAMPFRAETARGYLTGLSQTYFNDQVARGRATMAPTLPVIMESRFRYNPAFKSVYSIIPGVFMLILMLIPTMMTAIGVVREKESGSIANFRSTPITKLEFLLGKQLPYVIIALISFVSLLLLGAYVFGVPVKGSFGTLVAGVILYIGASTGFGLLISTFTSTQVAAIFAAAVLTVTPCINFSGLLVPVSTLSGAARISGLGYPAGWFMQVSLGTFTKSLGFFDLWPDVLALAGFALLFLVAATLTLRKQEA